MSDRLIQFLLSLGLTDQQIGKISEDSDYCFRVEELFNHSLEQIPKLSWILPSKDVNLYNSRLTGEIIIGYKNTGRIMPEGEGFDDRHADGEYKVGELRKCDETCLYQIISPNGVLTKGADDEKYCLISADPSDIIEGLRRMYDEEPVRFGATLSEAFACGHSTDLI